MINDAGLNQVRLYPEKLADKESMSELMKASLDLPDYFGGNLDALADVLSEVTQETVFEVDISDIGAFSPDEYPKKVLKVISHACEDNPHIHLYLTDKGI